MGDGGQNRLIPVGDDDLEPLLFVPVASFSCNAGNAWSFDRFCAWPIDADRCRCGCSIACCGLAAEAIRNCDAAGGSHSVTVILEMQLKEKKRVE